MTFFSCRRLLSTTDHCLFSSLYKGCKMSLSKQLITIKDSVSFTLNEADLTEKKVGDELKTSERDIPCSDGIKWWLEWHPAGLTAEEKNHISVFLAVNKAVSVKYTFKVPVSSIKDSDEYDFIVPDSVGPDKFASHEKLRPLFVDGKLQITCQAKFTFSVPFTCQTPRLAICGAHVPTDFELIMGTDRLQVHKSLLSLTSPVFYAMLSHDTVESKKGKVEITDFDFETVKTAIDFCYGRELETLSVETVVGMIRFADKYGMEGVTNQLEKIPRFNLSVEAFPTIVHYADDCSDEDLFEECCDFFEEHQQLIRGTEAFTKLPPSLVAHMLKETFDLETQFDILRHANSNGIDFILDQLEQPIIEGLSLDTFCEVVVYAWECSRVDLKNACAKFCNDNLLEISKMKAFVDLSPEVLHGVIKLGHEIMTEEQ